MEFACSHCVCIGSFEVHSKDMHVGLIGEFRLAAVVTVNVCVSPVIDW